MSEEYWARQYWEWVSKRYYGRLKNEEDEDLKTLKKMKEEEAEVV